MGTTAVLFIFPSEPLVDPLIVKLHESLTLPCNVTIPGLGRWTNEHEDTVAWCNQTSYWAHKGYNISHDKYLKGDFSLTILSAEYSMRGWYTCECDDM